MASHDRRYDIDWVRVIAIGLLLVYHSAIGFQSWGVMIGFITTEKPWPSLWTPMSMLNVWRIPLLFFVSGMGVFFAIRNRTWTQLILERSSRILLPFIFGIFAIVPISVALWQYYYGWDVTYSIAPGHLWFLGNIFLYVIILSPVFFYLKKNNSGRIARITRRIFGSLAGLGLLFLMFILEAIIVKPIPYELYAVTWHGFFLGLTAFGFGFAFVYSGDAFWKLAAKWRWFFLAVALCLYFYRMTQFTNFPPAYLPAIESVNWIIAVFGFASRYLNHPGPVLSYLSQAAYPIYILHMIFLHLGSLLIFRTTIPVPALYFIVLLITLAGCFGTYELIRRSSLLRPLFGLGFKKQTVKTGAIVCASQAGSGEM